MIKRNQSIDLDKKQAGFSLIEVLVSMMILAIGLLGLAGLQVNALKNNHNAGQRMVAILLTEDMMARMMAGRSGGVNSQLPSGYNGIDTSNTLYDPSGCGDKGAHCSANQRVQYNAYAWQQSLQTALPGAFGKVRQVANGSLALYEIKIMWDDDQQGTGTHCHGPSEQNLACLVTRFTP